MFNLLTDAASRVYIHKVHWRKETILRNSFNILRLLATGSRGRVLWHIWVLFGKSRLQILPRTPTVMADIQ
jgi:hypothetical protein